MLIRFKSWLISWSHVDFIQRNQQLIRIIRINCWFRWPYLLSLNFVNLFRAFNKFCWPFWGFPLMCYVCMTLLGHSNQVPWFESAHGSSSISKTWINSTHDSTAFQELTQNQLMTQVDSQGIDSVRFMTQSAYPFFDSNELMTLAKKNIWFVVSELENGWQ